MKAGRLLGPFLSFALEWRVAERQENEQVKEIDRF
jgi:hypothetical protein